MLAWAFSRDGGSVNFSTDGDARQVSRTPCPNPNIRRLRLLIFFLPFVMVHCTVFSLWVVTSSMASLMTSLLRCREVSFGTWRVRRRRGYCVLGSAFGCDVTYDVITGVVTTLCVESVKHGEKL